MRNASDREGNVKTFRRREKTRSWVDWRACALLVGALSAGCRSADDQTAVDAASAGPAVPDPGGPFQTSVPPDASLDSLSLVESDTLCRDLANAYYAFLLGAVQTQNSCRQVATGPIIGTDAATEEVFCSEFYEECLDAEPPIESSFICPFTLPGFEPNSGAPPAGEPSLQCTATVEDLSACLNEIAALDPVGRCVTAPGCDAGGSPDAEALDASAQALDSGDAFAPALDSVDAFAGEGGFDASPPISAMPACARLSQICPVVAIVAAFPC